MVLIKFFMMMALMFAMTFHSIAPAHANSDQDEKIQAAFLYAISDIVNRGPLFHTFESNHSESFSW